MKKFIAILAGLALCASSLAGTDPLPNYRGGILETTTTPSNGTNAIDTLTFGATITSGTFKLAFKGKTTTAISWTATDATLVSRIDAALEALATIGTGGVTTTAGTISSGVNGTITVTMTGNNAKLAVDAITVADNSLVGAAHTLTCAITTAGVTADGRTARIGQLLVDSGTPGAYQNTGTSLNPTWSVIPTVSDVLLASAPVFAHGLTASGSDANDFSGGSGTFKTSTGANTLGGAVSIADATTPSLTLATGKTNTGFISILGKTSGGLKLTVADASAFLVTATLAAQTSGTAALTIPDFAGVADTFAFTTKAQTLASKTLTTAIVTPKVTTISGDGAITIASGIVLLTKGSAAAITIAAPSSVDGTRITILSNSDAAHVVTFTGGTLLDGTTGANTTATFAAFKGAAITVVAIGTTWLSESINAVTPAP